MSSFIKQSRVLLAVLFLSSLSFVAQDAAAQEFDDGNDTYVGADVNFISMDALNETYNPINMRARLGVILLPDLIPVLAFETHFGFGLTDDTNTFDGQDIELGVNYYVGIYARASHEVADFVSVYGLLGAAVAQLNGDTIFVQDDTESSLSYGLGAIFNAPLDIGVNVEIMQLIGGDSFDIYMASLGASYKF